MKNLQTTGNLKWVAYNRFVLATIFLMTGFMKIALEKFGHAWEIQLKDAQIPFSEIAIWFVPFIEILIGGLLLIGFYSRILAVISITIMAVAIYVHLIVKNPEAFPAQPQLPIMPILIIGMSVILIWKGSGSWSKDLTSYLNQLKLNRVFQ